MKNILLVVIATLLFAGAAAHAYSDRGGMLTSWGERGILVEDLGKSVNINLWDPTTDAYTVFSISGTTASWAPSENKFALKSSVQNAGYSRWLPALSVYDTDTRHEQVVKAFDYTASYSYSWADDSHLLYGYKDDGQYGLGIIGLDGVETILESNPIGMNLGHGIEFGTVVSGDGGVFYVSPDFSGPEPVSNIWLRSDSGEYSQMLSGLDCGIKLFGIQNDLLYYGYNGSVPLVDLSPEMGDAFPDYYIHSLWMMSLATHQTSLVSTGRGQIGGISPDDQRLYLYDIKHDRLFPRNSYTYGYVESVPEPSAATVLGVGFTCALGLYRRKRC